MLQSINHLNVHLSAVSDPHSANLSDLSELSLSSASASASVYYDCTSLHSGHCHVTGRNAGLVSYLNQALNPLLSHNQEQQNETGSDDNQYDASSSNTSLDLSGMSSTDSSKCLPRRSELVNPYTYTSDSSFGSSRIAHDSHCTTSGSSNDDWSPLPKEALAVLHERKDHIYQFGLLCSCRLTGFNGLADPESRHYRHHRSLSSSLGLDLTVIKPEHQAPAIIMSVATETERLNLLIDIEEDVTHKRTSNIVLVRTKPLPIDPAPLMMPDACDTKPSVEECRYTRSRVKFARHLRIDTTVLPSLDVDLMISAPLRTSNTQAIASSIMHSVDKVDDNENRSVHRSRLSESCDAASIRMWHEMNAQLERVEQKRSNTLISIDINIMQLHRHLNRPSISNQLIFAGSSSPSSTSSPSSSIGDSAYDADYDTSSTQTAICSSGLSSPSCSIQIVDSSIHCNLKQTSTNELAGRYIGFSHLACEQLQTAVYPIHQSTVSKSVRHVRACKALVNKLVRRIAKPIRARILNRRRPVLYLK